MTKTWTERSATITHSRTSRYATGQRVPLSEAYHSGADMDYRAETYEAEWSQDFDAWGWPIGEAQMAVQS